jgi:pectate lyase
LSCELANTVQGFAALDAGVTGGAGGNYIVAKTGADLVAALATKKNNSNPLIIYINGTITPENSGVAQFDVKDMANVSIIGVGNAALFDGIGLNIVRANNIIVRNLTMRFVRIGQKDAISIDGTSTNVWIDHNELYNSLAVSKDYYDELVSGKGNIDKITISYNYLHDSWKTSLWGSSDTNSFNRRVTFYANHWENVNSRLPLFRFGEAHIFNNYYTNIVETGINSRMGAQMRIEGNHFENAKNPILSKDSSAVGYWDIGAEDTNLYDNVTWNPDTCNGETAGTCAVAGPEVATTQAYEPPYTYTVMPVAEVKAHVIANAGVSKISRACLGLPEDIIEGETGGGSTPGDGGSAGGDDGEDGQSSTADGGWTVEAMRMGGGSAISGSVSESSETHASFTITGGKFESSAEGFFFINKVVTGDFVFSANLSAWNTPTRSGSDQGSVGVMMCVECDNGGAVGASAKVGLRDTGILHSQRLAAGASMGKNTIALALVPSDQLYLRVARTGNSFTLSYSVDGGVTYTVARSNTFTDQLPEDVKVGLYAAQGNTDSNGFSLGQISLEIAE